ncbi:MAG: PAS domain-containing protein [Bacteroidales bacterium]|nr:PAS domain-containing protein [Bacteroidales bacterium]
MAPGNEKYYPGLQTLIDNLPGVVYRCRNDRDWTMQYISAAIIELSGYPVSDFINNNKRSYGSLIHEKDCSYVWNEIQKAVKKRSRFTLEYRIVNSEGNIKWVWERGRMVKDESGNRFIEGFIEDIHDWKIAEENVRNSEFRFRLFAESAPVGIVLSDKEENTIFINKQFTEIFGYTINDMPSVNEWWQLAYPDIQFRKQVQETWREEMLKAQNGNEMVESLEFPVNCKDGTIRDIEFRMASDNELNYIIFTDITERKKTEKELLELKENLQCQVAEKTKELKERVLELERFRDATIDRELRMKELRDELELLRKERHK